MKTPAQVLVAVADIGGSLSVVGDKLRMLLPASCPPELKGTIRQHKPALLELMRLTFLIIRSEVLDSIIFFVPDETTKESLVSAGADPGCIYTRAELDVLVRCRTTVRELRLIHAGKQQFSARIVE